MISPWLRHFAARLGYRVRIRSARHPVRSSRLRLEGLEDRAVPAIVAGVQVGDGSDQRSEVRSITVTFSELVQFLGGDQNAAVAFELTNVTAGANVALDPTISADAQGRTVVTLTFAGGQIDPVSGLNGGPPSLADGRYRLTIFAADVTDLAGRPLDGSGAGMPGSDYVSPPDALGGSGLHLYRLFGDANGDGVVDAIDLGQFRSTVNANLGNPAYRAYLDADNSGAVDAQDLAQFRSRINTNVIAGAENMQFYVNPATGDDANDGRSAQAAWKTWARLVQAVQDGTVPAGTWVTADGTVANLGMTPTVATKDAWYAAYTAGDRQVTGGVINIDTSGAALQVTAPLVLPTGTEIRSATDQLTDLEVEVPITATEVWARPDAVDFPAVWGTTSKTDYVYAAEYEQVGGQWAQLDPIVAANLTAALPLLESTAGSFFVDPGTHELYTHALAGDPNTDGVSREVTPNFFGEFGGKMIDVTGGLAYKIGIDGGFGFKPTTGEAFGSSGIGTSEWDAISVIDSCQVSHAGKHSFESVGNLATGFIVYRDDTATLGPGGVFVGFWTHFVDFSGQSAPGSAYSIYDGSRTVAGVANVNAPGGADDVVGGYESFITHNAGGADQFAGRTFLNNSFAGGTNVGGPETTAVVSTGNTFGNVVSDFAAAWASTDDYFGARLPYIAGGSAVLTDATIVSGAEYTGVTATLAGDVTFDGGTIDLSGANGYTASWERAGPVSLRLNNVAVKGLDSPTFGLVDHWADTDAFSATNVSFTGSASWSLFGEYNGGPTAKSWQWARDAGQIDDKSQLNRGFWTAVPFPSRATFTAADGTDLSAYLPEAGPGFTNLVGAWGIANGEALLTAAAPAGPNIAWLNAGRADATVTAILDVAAGGSPDAGLIVNGLDANNYWHADLAGTTLTLYQRVGGVDSVRGNYFVGSTAGGKHTLSVSTSGDIVVVAWDGVPRFSYTAGQRPLETVSYVGLLANGSAVTFDDFEVR
jgi:hypothetical protein